MSPHFNAMEDFHKTERESTMSCEKLCPTFNAGDKAYFESENCSLWNIFHFESNHCIQGQWNYGQLGGDLFFGVIDGWRSKMAPCSLMPSKLKLEIVRFYCSQLLHRNPKVYYGYVL